MVSLYMYSCDSYILSYFGSGGAATAALNETGEAAFKRQLYLCTLGQALFMTSQIESLRSQNMHGAIIWQVRLVLAIESTIFVQTSVFLALF